MGERRHKFKLGNLYLSEVVFVQPCSTLESLSFELFFSTQQHAEHFALVKNVPLTTHV